MIISLIVAKSSNNVIGMDNRLPFRLKDDLKLFKEITTNHHIIMGSKTYKSIGRPLPNRTNIVLSRKNSYFHGAIHSKSLGEAINIAKNNNESEVFIIGGAEVYHQALPFADKIYLTRVNCEIISGDAYLYFDLDDWDIVSEKKYYKNENNEFDFVHYELIRK